MYFGCASVLQSIVTSVPAGAPTNWFGTNIIGETVFVRFRCSPNVWNICICRLDVVVVVFFIGNIFHSVFDWYNFEWRIFRMFETMCMCVCAFFFDRFRLLYPLVSNIYMRIVDIVYSAIRCNAANTWESQNRRFYDENSMLVLLVSIFIIFFFDCHRFVLFLSPPKAKWWCRHQTDPRRVKK